MNPITIATRGSRLALWQAEHVAARLRERLGAACGPDDIRLLVVKTKGDIILDTPLAKIGGKGLFVKEIEEALLDGRADIAVHSMKDMPMDFPDGLTLAAVLEREDPADMLFSAAYSGLMVLPSGATVGTSSLRRQAQLLARRPDVRVEPLRGNVDTRLRKLQEGQFDAIIMAAAGIKRLSLYAPFMDRLAPSRFVPAAGQGAIGIECRTDDAALRDLLHGLEHTATRLCVEAERGFLARLDGSCQVPIAAYGVMAADGALTLEGMLARTNGSEVVSRKATGAPAGDTTAARALGAQLAEEVLENGGRSVLNAVLYARD